jgi:hypothetical protein
MFTKTTNLITLSYFNLDEIEIQYLFFVFFINNFPFGFRISEFMHVHN